MNKAIQEEKYVCYSNRLRRFLDSHGVRFMDRQINNATGLPVWIFRKTKKLDRLLKMYTEKN